MKRLGYFTTRSAYASFIILATSGWPLASAKNTFGVERETTSTSMPTRSMSSMRFATSVIGGWMPKKRAPL